MQIVVVKVIFGAGRRSTVILFFLDLILKELF
jgi:hypothetical protein